MNNPAEAQVRPHCSSTARRCSSTATAMPGWTCWSSRASCRLWVSCRLRRTRDSGDASRPLSALETAFALYRGPFLEGLSLPDSAAYEEWVLVMRERWQRQAMDALQRLSAHWEQRGEYERALQHARRQVELEPWDEAAQRAVMRLLALSGQRSAALAQYEVCVRALAEELGVEPSAETMTLYRRIRDETVGREPGPAQAIVPSLLPSRRPYRPG